MPFVQLPRASVCLWVCPEISRTIGTDALPPILVAYANIRSPAESRHTGSGHIRHLSVRTVINRQLVSGDATCPGPRPAFSHGSVRQRCPTSRKRSLMFQTWRSWASLLKGLYRARRRSCIRSTLRARRRRSRHEGEKARAVSRRGGGRDELVSKPANVPEDGGGGPQEPLRPQGAAGAGQPETGRSDLHRHRARRPQGGLSVWTETVPPGRRTCQD